MLTEIVQNRHPHREDKEVEVHLCMRNIKRCMATYYTVHNWTYVPSCIAGIPSKQGRIHGYPSRVRVGISNAGQGH